MRVNESHILYCSQEKETVPRRIDILCVSEGNQCSTVLKRIGALLFSGEGNQCSCILKRTGALLFSA